METAIPDLDGMTLEQILELAPTDPYTAVLMAEVERPRQNNLGGSEPPGRVD